MKTTQPLLFVAWKKLIGAYLLSLAIGFLAGVLLVKIGNIKPESIYELSTKRLSYALPVLDMGARHGIDNGISLFVWNSIGALITMSFIYTAALFDPDHIGLPPRVVRKIFCGKTRMKIFCYLPGCTEIEEESLAQVICLADDSPAGHHFAWNRKRPFSFNGNFYLRVLFFIHHRASAAWSD